MRRTRLTADETTFRKLVLRVAATARASSVLPRYQLVSFLGPAIKSILNPPARPAYLRDHTTPPGKGRRKKHTSSWGTV
jgi:hypothetical protein